MNSKQDLKNLNSSPMNGIQFQDIFNLDDIQNLQDLFSDATGVASVITNPEGRPITSPSSYCRLCDELINKSHSGLTSFMVSGSMPGNRKNSCSIMEPRLSLGLWYAGASITVSGQHIANWLIGQVRNEESDENSMIQYADEIGADRTDFMKAMSNIPVMSVFQFNKVANMLFAYVSELSEKAGNNLQLKIQIAEREKATAMLQESKENISITLNSIGDAVISTDKNGLVVSMNPIAESLCGWKLADAQGKPLPEVFNIINSETREKVADPVKKVLKSSQIIGVANHTVLISKNGTEYQISDSAAPIKNKDGKISGVVMVFSDVTSKYNTEKALRESERSKSVLLSNLPGMAYRCRFDSDWTMEFVSEACYNLTGYRGESLILNRDITFNDLILPGYRDHLWEVWNKAVQSHGIVCEEYKILTADKKIKWVWEQGIPIYHKNGEVEALEGYIIDITERKQAEEALKNERLLLRTLIDNIPDSIYTKDLECNKTLANLTELRYMGANSEAEVLGKSDYDFYPEEIAAKFYADDQSVIQTGMPVLNREEYINDENGQKRWLLTSKIPLRDTDGRTIGLAGIGHDITGRRQAEEALKESEIKYRLIFEYSPLGILSFDENGVILACNNSFAQIIGSPVEKLLGLKILNLPDKKMVSAVREALNGNTGLYDDLYQSVTSGKIVPVRALFTPMDTGNGFIRGGVGIIEDISERKHAEQALRESEEKYRHIFENVQDVFYQTDLTGTILEISPSIKRFSDHSREEIIGTDVATLYYNRADRGLLLDKILKEGELRDYELKLKTKTGEIKYVSNNARLITGADGKPSHIDGAIRDITRRKRVEDELSGQKNFFEQMFMQSSVSTQILDRDGWCERINPRLSKLFGVEPQDIEGKIYNIFKDEGIIQGGIIPYLEIAFHQGKTVEWEVFFDIGIAADSQNIEVKEKKRAWFYNWAYPIFDETGQVGNVIIQHNDITERKQVEHELIKAKNEAEKSEYKVRSMFENTLTGFVFFTNKGEVLEANPAAISILGSPSLEATKKINGLTYQPLIDNGFSREMTNCLNQKRVISNEIIYKSKWGKTSYVKYFLIPVLNKDEIIGIWANLQDLTDLWITQNDLKNAKERAEESDRLKSAFLANMSHEIRTPMNGILGFAGLLKEPGLTGEDQLEFIKIIEKSGARMLNIINDIIDISKIESGQMKISVSKTKINEQTSFLYAFFKPEAEKKGIQLIVKNGLPDKEAIIFTDREKIYAILTNLVKNAVKYTAKGSIVFGYEKKGEYLEFYVKDTGFGIPHDRQQAIFDRFVQADISDRKALQGAGLGLSISKAYAEMLGGNIWVESREGRGSEFYFTIPYRIETVSNTGIPNTIPENTEVPSINKLKILIAEDDETSEILLLAAIKMFKKEVLVVRTGVDAVETCRNNPDIDLVILDIKMPEMDGYQATRLIRQFNKDVFIIAQTAFGLSDDRHKAIEAGCDDYISKPINISLLKGMIQKHFINRTSNS